MSTLDKLKGLNDRLNRAQVQENHDNDFPDGNYLVWIEKAELTEVKQGENAGQPQVKWQLRVIDGPAGTVNRCIFHYHRLFGKTDEQLDRAIGRFKIDMHRIQCSIDDFEILPNVLDELVEAEAQIKVTLKTGQSNIQNVYFNGIA